MTTPTRLRMATATMAGVTATMAAATGTGRTAARTAARESGYEGRARTLSMVHRRRERERESMLRTLTTMLMVLGQSCAAPCETAHVDRQAGGGRASVDPELSRSRWGSRRTTTGGTGACRGLQRQLGTAEGQVGRAFVGLCTCPDAWTAGHMAARRNRQRRPVTRDVLHEHVDPHTPVRLPPTPSLRLVCFSVVSCPWCATCEANNISY